MQDLEDTTGSWELYGTDDDRRYPSLQNEFFERAAAPLTRRGSTLAFIFAGAALRSCCPSGSRQHPGCRCARCSLKSRFAWQRRVAQHTFN